MGIFHFTLNNTTTARATAVIHLIR